MPSTVTTGSAGGIAWPRIASALVLLLCAILAVTTSSRNSITIDEFGNLPRGLHVWHDRDFSLDAETTPLPSMLAALPVTLTGPVDLTFRSNQEVTPWTVGEQFMRNNEAQYQRVYTIARFVSILALLAACAGVWGFARTLYGEAGGLIALVIACFTPELVAHGTLVTADIYLAGGFVVSLWAFDALLRTPDWRRGLTLGLAIGVTIAFKFTGLLLLALLPLALAAVTLWRRWNGTAADDFAIAAPRAALWLGAAFVVAIVVVNVVYTSVPFASVPFGDITFVSPTMRRIAGFVPGWLPSPFPIEFVRGIDAQFSEAPYDAYLLGKFNTTGFWNYYLVGLLVKTPEPIILLAVAALTLWRRLLAREVPLLLVGVGAFVIMSLGGHKNIGMRHVLFVAPLLAVWIGRLAAAPLWRARPRLMRRGVAAACASLIVVTLAAWPHYLAYFNAASGGSDNGHTYLLDSNIDWGQDLITLRDYMARERIEAIDLAYFGRVDPKIYGINYVPLWDTIKHRYVVISANFLWGRGYGVYGTGRALAERDQFATFLSVTPKTILGHSLYLFDLGAH